MWGGDSYKVILNSSARSQRYLEWQTPAMLQKKVTDYSWYKFDKNKVGANNTTVHQKDHLLLLSVICSGNPKIVSLY